MSWISRLGDAISARVTTPTEEIQRQLAEPPLTDAERQLFDRYHAIMPYLIMEDERLRPPPPKATAYNRRNTTPGITSLAIGA